MYPYGTIPISVLADEAEKTLDNHCYFAALALSFALVSRCAAIKYPDEWFDENAQNDEYLQTHFPWMYRNGTYSNRRSHDTERFCMWWDDWSSSHSLPDGELKDHMVEFEQSYAEFRDNGEDENGNKLPPIPTLDGELLYRIRCAFVHDATNIFDFDKLHDAGNKTIGSFRFVIDKLNPYHTGSTCSGCGPTCNEFHVSVQGLVGEMLHHVRKYCNDRELDVDCIKAVDETGTYF